MSRSGKFVPSDLRLPSLVDRVTLRSRRSHERGASLVEYAFILFIFLTLIFGIGGFGHALFVYHFLDHAAKEGTRYAAVRGSTCATDGSCAALNSASGTAGPTTLSDVNSYVASITPQSIDSSKITVTACGVGGSPAPPACADSTPTVCTTAIGSGATAIPATPNYPGCTVQVQVSYPYNFIFPFLPSVTTTTAPCTAAGICMTSTSEMIIAH